MKVITTLPLTIERNQNTTVGFVPTMGFLHEGHISLIKEAREQCDIVVLSIFVNPLQFGPNEDLARYPRDPERDLQLARQHGVDYVFMPPVEVMYPQPSQTIVQVHKVTDRLCGASRPGHFDGVATVVSKLFHLVKPDKAYFGQKDAQQIAVIQQMVADLNMDVTIVSCPIYREHDGLALSSRNVYLSSEEREQALVLYESLQLGSQLLANGITLARTKESMSKMITAKQYAKIDYIEILTYPGLEPLPETSTKNELSNEGTLIIALAVWIGKTRLIDNQLFEIG